MIDRFDQFMESKKEDYLLFYAFDWDDNLLYMPTVIHMEKREGDQWIPRDVSTTEFSVVRNDGNNWRILNNNPNDAYSNFRDYGPKGPDIFLEDVQKAVRARKFGPSWNDFIECLTSGAIFAIITARGHKPRSIRKAIRWIIDEVLTEDQVYEMYNNLKKFSYYYSEDKGEGSPRILTGKPSNNKLVQDYLHCCDFVCVSDPDRKGDAKSPEKSKEKALMEFNKKVNKFGHWKGIKVRIGFSDDDVNNIKHIEDLMDNLNKEKFPYIADFTVKGTKYPQNITKKVKVLETSNQDPGLESSVIKFTQFGNMTNQLYPKGPDQRQDDNANAFKRATKYLTQTSKNIVKRKKRKKKF